MGEHHSRPRGGRGGAAFTATCTVPQGQRDRLRRVKQHVSWEGWRIELPTLRQRPLSTHRAPRYTSVNVQCIYGQGSWALLSEHTAFEKTPTFRKRRRPAQFAGRPSPDYNSQAPPCPRTSRLSQGSACASSGGAVFRHAPGPALFSPHGVLPAPPGQGWC